MSAQRGIEDQPLGRAPALDVERSRNSGGTLSPASRMRPARA